MDATFSLSAPVVAVGSPSVLDLLITFRPGSAETEAHQRRALNLSVVIDRSGSMAGRSLQQALQAAETLVERLEPDDILSVVVYDDTVETVFAPAVVNDKRAVRELIHKVRPGGTTNLSGGWLKGCEHVLARHDPRRIQRVLLLTDGQANVGVTDPQVLTNTARQKAEAGAVTTTLGFGQGFNEDLLIGMARAAGGNFYFIQTPDDAADVFRIELESLASVVAQNLTVNIAPARSGANAHITGLLSNYRSEVRDDGVYAVMMGDVYENEDKFLALEFSLPAQTASHPELPLFEVNCTFEKVVDGVIQRLASQQSMPITVRLGTADEAISASPALDVMLQVSRIKVAKAKERAVEEADRGNVPAATGVLTEVLAELRKKGLDEHFEIAEEIAQLEHFIEQLERRQFDAASRKEMRDQSYQARFRNRSDLSQRGVAGGSARELDTTKVVEGGVELACYREGGKLRIKVISDGYDPLMNVQFPRSIREEGVHYVVDALEPSANGTFYRAIGQIRRLVLPGQENWYSSADARKTGGGAPKASKISARTAADLEPTTSVGEGVLVQCIKEGSKLRARVVSDGFDPNFNMRFPRDIREEGMLYVVDEVIEASGGGSYIACGKIRRFVQ